MTEQQPLTPQEELAQEITDALFEKKLISENKRKRLPQQISMGLLDADDWVLLVDMAAEQGVNGNETSIDLVEGND